MIDKYEAVIKKQQEIHTLLQERLDADEVIIDSQKQQIRLLTEKTAILEKENRELIDAGKRLSQAYAHLERLCTKQQALLEELSDMVK